MGRRKYRSILLWAAPFYFLTQLTSCTSCEQLKDCVVKSENCFTRCNGDETCRLGCVEAFKECSGTKFVFPVHFCVVTNNDSASRIATYAQLQQEVDILNLYFTARDPSLSSGRRALVAFTFKSASLYHDITGMTSDLVAELQRAVEINDWTRIKEYYAKEMNTAILDPGAINIFIYDAWDSTNGWGNTDGHGTYNDYSPIILLDYTRLNHVQAAEEHEMGHAFGLAHVCETGATSTSSTNIMACSRDYPSHNEYGYIGLSLTYVDCPYSGGLRDIGFNAAQSLIILDSAQKIMDKLE